MIEITRERWIIVRQNEPIEIFCGLARNYKFKPINEIGDTAIKTYLSKSKAESSFVSSWTGGYDLLVQGRARAVKVTEFITEDIK